jgi:4-hydroxy-tetrahydrodipicolinate synthase
MPLKPEEIFSKIRGPLTIFPTHFSNDGKLDLGAMRTSAEYAREVYKGHDGCVMIAGSTSEFYAMTDDESAAMIKAVTDVLSGHVPVIAGTGRAATGLSVEMTRRAADLGIDMALISNPYYMHISEEGLYRHFSQVAESIPDTGIMIYDNPTTSKIAIPPQLMAKLSKIPNIIAVKENTVSLENYYWMTQAVDPKDMVISCGIGHLMYLFEAPLGCRAYVSEILCFAPKIAFAIQDAAERGDYEEMRKEVSRLDPYLKFVGRCVARRNIPTILGTEYGGKATSVYQSILKKAMELVGLPGGLVRDPLDNITDAEVSELRKIFQEIGLVR